MEIQISNNIRLKKIALKDQKKLFDLMREIYLPMYRHLWEDKGEWYLNELYSITNLKKELSQEKQEYYFVLNQDRTIGILRIIFGIDFKNHPDNKSLKLHRIYLHPNTQGKGLGKKIVSWIETIGIEKKYENLWLEAMDTQEQALHFYKNKGFSTVNKKILDFSLLHIHLRGMYVMLKKLN